MATGQWPTLVDLLSRIAPDGKQYPIAEMLSQANEIWADLPLIEANGIGVHEFTFRTSIPSGTWRQYNQGVPYAKSTTAKAMVGLGDLEDYSQIDRLLAEDSGDAQRYRMNEDAAFLEGMSQTMAQTIFYGNTTVNPAQFMGLSPFYNTINLNNAQNAANVLDGLGAGNSNTSLWLVGWGERTLTAIYPRGSKAGLAMEDKGDTTPGFDSLGNRFEAYTSWFRHQMGLCPMDWRYAARLANLDTTAAGLAGPQAPDLFAIMAQMIYLMPQTNQSLSGITSTDAPNDPSPGNRFAWYANRTLRHWLDVQSMRNRNVLLTLNESAGRTVTSWRGIPIRTVDQLLNTEARVA